MKFATLKNVAICFMFLLFATGCTTYYRISDRASGSTYYTTDYDRTDSGAVVFKDARSSSKVTLQSSEVREISKSDFEIGRKK